jgi:hypothetical protein
MSLVRYRECTVFLFSREEENQEIRLGSNNCSDKTNKQIRNVSVSSFILRSSLVCCACGHGVQLSGE